MFHQDKLFGFVIIIMVLITLATNIAFTFSLLNHKDVEEEE